MPVTIATLGFPRIGQRRELKFALERYWSGKSGAEALQGEARALRAAAWSRQGSLGVDHVPSNDFSLYDHVLDMSAVLGAVPPAMADSPPPPLSHSRSLHDDLPPCLHHRCVQRHRPGAGPAVPPGRLPPGPGCPPSI